MCTDDLYNFADFGNRQRRAVEVALGALNEDDLDAAAEFIKCVGDRRQVNGAVAAQIDLAVFHAEITE